VAINGIFHFSEASLYGSQIIVQRLLLLRGGSLDFRATLPAPSAASVAAHCLSGELDAKSADH